MQTPRAPSRRTRPFSCTGSRQTETIVYSARNGSSLPPMLRALRRCSDNLSTVRWRGTVKDRPTASLWITRLAIGTESSRALRPVQPRGQVLARNARASRRLRRERAGVKSERRRGGAIPRLCPTTASGHTPCLGGVSLTRIPNWLNDTFWDSNPLRKVLRSERPMRGTRTTVVKAFDRRNPISIASIRKITGIPPIREFSPGTTVVSKSQLSRPAPTRTWFIFVSPFWDASASQRINCYIYIPSRSFMELTEYRPTSLASRVRPHREFGRRCVVGREISPARDPESGRFRRRPP